MGDEKEAGQDYPTEETDGTVTIEREETVERSETVEEVGQSTGDEDADAG